ncbi:hypothetical protein RIEGSTA812A_PEG_869 [invertebrate metagenome]|uniref:DUF465 domain-containing protein n=1 Tax=invertebrate metagenome TaxID=1711999 RepID=A0A484H5R8_9ZZZZ
MHKISQKDGYQQLAELQIEHRDIDDMIVWLIEHRPADQLRIQRLKKRQLMLKDQISWLERKLIPDIIA